MGIHPHQGLPRRIGDNKNYVGDVALVGEVPKDVFKHMKTQIKADNPGFRKGLAVLPSLYSLGQDIASGGGGAGEHLGWRRGPARSVEERSGRALIPREGGVA